MADLTLNAAKIAPVFAGKGRIFSYIASVDITAGTAVRINSNGKIEGADASDAGTAQFRGIALQSVGAGQPVDVMDEGHITGFTISALAYDAPIYLSADGKLGTTAGTVSVVVGRIAPLSDKDFTKVLRLTGMAG
jgi:hypothetical protein